MQSMANVDLPIRDVCFRRYRFPSGVIFPLSHMRFDKSSPEACRNVRLYTLTLSDRKCHYGGHSGSIETGTKNIGENNGAHENTITSPGWKKLTVSRRLSIRLTERKERNVRILDASWNLNLEFFFSLTMNVHMDQIKPDFHQLSNCPFFRELPLFREGPCFLSVSNFRQVWYTVSGGEGVPKCMYTST